MLGYLRADGRKGIRNITLVCYLVECAQVHLIGFPGCYPNAYALKQLTELSRHPNVGAILLVSLGCEGFNREALALAAKLAGRPIETLVIQQSGGTRNSIMQGIAAVKSIQAAIVIQRELIGVDELVIGTICGGSDGTSGITANPAVGRCFDILLAKQATCIFEETGELIGCEQIMAERAVTEELGHEIESAVHKAEDYYTKMGFGSFAPGNAEGGLTTQEEKSMGAYSKSGHSKINGLIKPGDIPPKGGLYLMDVVPDGGPMFGFPNISDNAEIVEMIASGAHLILFTTGRGSVVGSAISPVIKVCANPDTYQNLHEDMDINAGRILAGSATVDEVGEEIYQLLLAVVAGQKTKSEELGHQEFILTYKQFEPIGPSCLPFR
jgi:altronate dehydratase large subunit